MNHVRTSASAGRNLKDINVLCWTFCVAALILPQCLAIKDHIQSGRLQKVPEISFVYFYSMGRLFNEYPAAQVYNYELQKKVFTEVHAQNANRYGPIPYPPYVGVLFRPFACLTFSAACLLWWSISFSLYIAGLFLLTGHFFPHEPLRRSLIFCFALSFWPFFHFLTTGQISMIGFFAMAVALREEHQEHPIRSGLALSLCLYKPTLLLLFIPMLLVTRRYRTLLGFASGGIALAILATAVEGVGVWPGYLHMVLSFGSAATARTQQAFTIHSTSYVDLVSFFSVLPGGRSLPARAILIACAAYTGFFLVRTWWKSVAAGKAAQTLVWAATLTWTLVLNVYVPIYDTVLIVLSVIATDGVLKDFPDRRIYRRFTPLWVLILAFSWITVPIAKHIGFQIITVLFALLGTLQLTVLHSLAEAPALESQTTLHFLPNLSNRLPTFFSSAVRLACETIKYDKSSSSPRRRARRPQAGP